MADLNSEVLLEVPLSPAEPATAHPQSPKLRQTPKAKQKLKPKWKPKPESEAELESESESESEPGLELEEEQEQKQKQKQPGRRRRTESSSESFATYFPLLLNRVHVGLSLSPQAVSIVDSFVKDMFERIASEASHLTRSTQRATMMSREIQTAVRLQLPGDLAKQAVSMGTQALLRYIQCQ